MKYAVMQTGYAIYGVGDTERDAMENAVQWIDEARSADDVADLISKGNGFHGDFKIAKITDKLADQAGSDGALPWDQLDDGTYCTVEEAAE